MNYGSICSGVEAATLAWAPLGWKAVFFAETEPFPAAVLQQRFGATRPLRPLLPDAPRYKACGNSMCVNVMAWIGHRIDAVEKEIAARSAE